MMLLDREAAAMERIAGGTEEATGPKVCRDRIQWPHWRWRARTRRGYCGSRKAT